MYYNNARNTLQIYNLFTILYEFFVTICSSLSSKGFSYVKVRQQGSSQVKIFVVCITLTPAFVNLDFRLRGVRKIVH